MSYILKLVCPNPYHQVRNSNCDACLSNNNSKSNFPSGEFKMHMATHATIHMCTYADHVWFRRQSMHSSKLNEPPNFYMHWPLAIHWDVNYNCRATLTHFLNQHTQHPHNYNNSNYCNFTELYLIVMYLKLRYCLPKKSPKSVIQFMLTYFSCFEV